MNWDVCDGASLWLNIDYCNELKKSKKWVLMGLGLLWSFNYAIYDGLEMILKVTKTAKNVYVNTLHEDDDDGWVCHCPLSSVFFYFDVSPHLSPLNGLERSKMVHGGLSTVCMMVLKEVKMVHGGLLSTVYVSDGLESSQFCSYTQWSWNESIHHVGPKWSWKKSFMGDDFLLGLGLGLSL